MSTKKELEQELSNLQYAVSLFVGHPYVADMIDSVQERDEQNRSMGDGTFLE